MTWSKSVTSMLMDRKVCLRIKLIWPRIFFPFRCGFSKCGYSNRKRDSPPGPLLRNWCLVSSVPGWSEWKVCPWAVPRPWWHPYVSWKHNSWSNGRRPAFKRASPRSIKQKVPINTATNNFCNHWNLDEHWRGQYQKYCPKQSTTFRLSTTTACLVIGHYSLPLEPGLCPGGWRAGAP